VIGLKLNAALGLPIYRQIVDGVREMIAAGTLHPGDRLPSIRELSTELRINPSSAVKAYAELQHAGVIVLDHGRGTFVSNTPDVARASRDLLLTNELQAVLSRARAWGFSSDQVLKALRRAISENGDT
jgi:GntR family transcriptional regulator